MIWLDILLFNELFRDKNVTFRELNLFFLFPASIKGVVNDGVNALSRFYIKYESLNIIIMKIGHLFINIYLIFLHFSNFEDGEHQDALDILLEKRPLPSSYKLGIIIFWLLINKRSYLTFIMILQHNIFIMFNFNVLF